MIALLRRKAARALTRPVPVTTCRLCASNTLELSPRFLPLLIQKFHAATYNLSLGLLVGGHAMDRQPMGFGAKIRANRFASTLVILATLSLGILIGTVVSAGVKGKEKAPSSDATPLSVPSPQQLSSQFSQVARQLEPTVVNIRTESTIKNPHRGRRTPGNPNDD